MSGLSEECHMYFSIKLIYLRLLCVGALVCVLLLVLCRGACLASWHNYSIGTREEGIDCSLSTFHLASTFKEEGEWRCDIDRVRQDNLCLAHPCSTMLFCHFTRLALLVFGCSRTVAYACTHNLGCGVRVCVHTLYPIKKCAHFFSRFSPPRRACPSWWLPLASMAAVI